MDIINNTSNIEKIESRSNRANATVYSIGGDFGRDEDRMNGQIAYARLLAYSCFSSLFRRRPPRPPSSAVCQCLRTHKLLLYAVRTNGSKKIMPFPLVTRHFFLVVNMVTWPHFSSTSHVTLCVDFECVESRWMTDYRSNTCASGFKEITLLERSKTRSSPQWRSGCSTTSHIWLDLRSPIWGFGESLT